MSAATRASPPRSHWQAWVTGACQWLLWLGLAAFAAGQAQAQTMLDEVDSRLQGDTQIVRIRFNASVRFVQIVPAEATDLYTLRFEVITADEATLRGNVEEFRRLAASDGLPEFAITYSPEPATRIKQLSVRLSRVQALQARQGINARSIELLVRKPAPPPSAQAPAQPAAQAPAESAAPVALARRYVLKLQTVTLADKDQIGLVPKEFQQLEVMTTAAVVDGGPGLDLSVGYFNTRQEAEDARQLALARFPKAQIVDVSPAAAAPPPPADISTKVAQPAEPNVARPAAADAAIDVAQADAEREAATLIEGARAELAAQHADAAVVLLNRLLKLPPNRQSMEAQALIGSAWEQSGNPLRARVEYDLYLKLYPQSEAAGRVSRQLAALGGPIVKPADGSTASSGGAGGATMVEPPKPWSGTLAQYYYGGVAQSKSLVNIATGIDQSTLSKTNESSIVTSVDLSGRYVGQNGSETRAVIRGSGSANLLSTSHSSSSIGAAYVEHRIGGDGLAVRVGRQSPISGGLLGLFDGVSLAYPVVTGIKVDVMGGVPAGGLVSAPGERLFAAVVEADSYFERFGGNFYLLDQTTQGITNRRSLGAELRYAGEQWSTNTLIDYDALFRMVNAVSVHGSFQVGQQMTLTLLGDNRRAPSLELTNALISSGAASLKTLLQTRTMDEIRSDALATSSIARQLLVSISRPLSPRWQASADVRYSAIGALPAVGDFTATAATGAQYSYSAQLTGTNLYSKRDINNFNLSVMTTPTFNGMQLSYNNLTGIDLYQHEATLEPSMRLYTQRDNLGVSLTRLGPGLRLTYKQSRKSSLLGELLYENSRTSGPTNHDSSNSFFFYVGYRYELF